MKRDMGTSRAALGPSRDLPMKEILWGTEPMYISPYDAVAHTPDQSKYTLKPGDSVDLVCEDHPFIQAYGDAAQISLRSVLAQCGLDLDYGFDPRRYQMGIKFSNHGPNGVFCKHPISIGAVYVPGEPLDTQRLKALVDHFDLMEGDRKEDGIKVFEADSLPGIANPTLALPVRFVYPAIATIDRDISLKRLESGTDRSFIESLNGTSAQPQNSRLASHQPTRTGIQISSSVRMRTPAGVALVIRQAVRYEGSTPVEIPHVNSRLIKGHSATNGTEYHPHRIRFETYGPDLPDYVICDAYAFEYSDF